MSEVVPDRARVTVGVTLDKPTAAQATADVARAMQSVVEVIRAEGIADRDVRSEAITLVRVTPENDRAAPSRARIADFYRVSALVIIQVSPAERAGALMSHLVDRGANVIEGVDYESSREKETVDGLRADAARDARRKAELYVAALGLSLGRVLEITPTDEAGFQPRYAMRIAAPPPAPAPALPVQPGLLTLRAAVMVRWEILQAVQTP